MFFEKKYIITSVWIIKFHFFYLNLDIDPDLTPCLLCEGQFNNYFV